MQQRRTRLGGGVIGGAHTLAAGGAACGARFERPQLAAGLHGSRPGVCAASQSWSSACASFHAWKEGGRVADRACLRSPGLRQQLAAAACLRRERLAGLLRRLAPLAARHSSSPSATAGPVLAVESGAASSSAVWVMTTSAGQHGVHRTPGGDRPGQSPARVGRQERQGEQRGCWPNFSGFSALQAEGAGALSGGPWITAGDFGPWPGRATGWTSAPCGPGSPLIPPPPGLLHGCATPFCSGSRRHAGGQAVVAGECHRGRRPLRVWRSPDEQPAAKPVSLKSVGLAALMARPVLFFPGAR